MSKQKTPPPEPQPEEKPQFSQAQRRWYWVRTALLTVLMFTFVMWYTYPSRGPIAILWSAGLAALILGYFTFSYYKLYR